MLNFQAPQDRPAQLFARLLPVTGPDVEPGAEVVLAEAAYRDEWATLFGRRAQAELIARATLAADWVPAVGDDTWGEIPVASHSALLVELAAAIVKHVPAAALALWARTMEPDEVPSFDD